MRDHVASPVEESPRTAILLCWDLTVVGGGLDVWELRSWLEAAYPEVVVGVMHDLCDRPTLLPPFVLRHGASRVVLGLCSSDYSRVEVHANARRAGLDPFGVEVVPLGTLCARTHLRSQATWKARAMLVSAMKRAHAFRQSGPEHAKPYILSLTHKVSRRHLFTVPPIGYQPVPGILGERCAAESGCQICVRSCPKGALQKTGKGMFLHKAQCTGCGVCLAACPREAIYFPGWSLQQMEAQLTAMLEFARSEGEPCSLLFACERTLGKLEKLEHDGIPCSHRWLPIIVPCLGMVTPSWILQSLAHGGRAVGLLSCVSNCPYAQQSVVGGRVNFCRRLLGLLGQSPDRVRVVNPLRPKELLRFLQSPPVSRISNRQPPLPGTLRLGTPDAAFKAFLELIEPGNSSMEVVLEHHHSPFGVLEFQPEGCTSCLACVEACPTEALASESSEDGVILTWLASSCIGCGMCADACPEKGSGILRVRKTTDLDSLSRGRAVLHRDRFAMCDRCGAIIASEALLRRLQGVLKGDQESLRAVLGKYCASCRVSMGLVSDHLPVHSRQGGR